MATEDIGEGIGNPYRPGTNGYAAWEKDSVTVEKDVFRSGVSIKRVYIVSREEAIRLVVNEGFQFAGTDEVPAFGLVRSFAWLMTGALLVFVVTLLIFELKIGGL